MVVYAGPGEKYSPASRERFGEQAGITLDHFFGRRGTINERLSGASVKARGLDFQNALSTTP